MYLRETLLGKALKALLDYEEEEYVADPARNLVEEEIAEEKRAFHLRTVKERKQRVLIACEIAKLAFEENLLDLAMESAGECVKADWDPHREQDLVIAQSESHYILAQSYVEKLLEEEIEIGFKELITLEEDQEEREFTSDDRKRFAEWKQLFVDHVQKGVKAAQATK